MNHYFTHFLKWAKRDIDLKSKVIGTWSFDLRHRNIEVQENKEFIKSDAMWQAITEHRKRQAQ